MDYVDFELEIGDGQGREFLLRVLRSPAGEARATMHFPHDRLALDNRLQAIEIELLRSAAPRRRMTSRHELAAETFGTELFDALVTGAVRSRWEVSRREAARRGLGIRLKLRIESPELAALPWEFLRDPERGEYLGLSRSTPIVRYLELPHPVEPLRVAAPLRILAMAAAPADLEALDVDRERRRIEAALAHLQRDGTVEVHWLEGQDWRTLQRALRGGPWHVFHFVGHGGFDRNADEGVIALVGSDGDSRRVSATELGRLLADHRSLRLVLLNSCEAGRSGGRDVFSSTASILVRRGIPAVLAMQYEITDRASIEFARGFYEAVGDGLAIDDAVTEARKAVSLAIPGTIEWATPVLYMHAPDGVLFDLRGPAPTDVPGAGTTETAVAARARSDAVAGSDRDDGEDSVEPDRDHGGESVDHARDEGGAVVDRGNAEVVEVLDIADIADGIRVLAGVVEGAVHAGTRVRVVRDGTVVCTGRLVALATVESGVDVPTASAGNDVVMVLAVVDRPRPGDVLESFEWLADGSQRTRDGLVAALRHGDHVVSLKYYPSPEEVFHDGRLVSSHSSWTLRSQPHEFDVHEDGEDVHYEIRTGTRWTLKWWWEVRRDGHLLHSDR